MSKKLSMLLSISVIYFSFAAIAMPLINFENETKEEQNLNLVICRPKKNSHTGSKYWVHIAKEKYDPSQRKVLVVQNNQQFPIFERRQIKLHLQYLNKQELQYALPDSEMKLTISLMNPNRDKSGWLQFLESHLEFLPNSESVSKVEVDLSCSINSSEIDFDNVH